VKARLSTDGGSRGNPGPAAYGYVLEAEDGHVLAAHGEAIGRATNNVAEYRALVAGLVKALELGVDEVEVVSDSELLVRQMTGVYRVKNATLQELWREAADLGEWSLDIVAAFMRAAYGKGYCDALTEENPGSLCHDHGYRVPPRRVPTPDA
jgi:ribonuclease HI